MAWLDDLLSFGSKVYETAKPVAETAWNFAKENPTVAGAGLGLLTGGGTGDYGSNNFRNAMKGGAAGFAAGQMFGGGTSAPSQVAAGMTPQMPQQDGITKWIAGNAGKVGEASATGAANYAAPTAFGAGVGDTMETIGRGVDQVGGFLKQNQKPFKLGLGVLDSFQEQSEYNDAKDRYGRQLGMLRQGAETESATNAENKRLVDDSNAAERAYSAMAPRNAYSNVMNATGRAVRAAGMEPNQTATQSAARRRSLSLAGTTGATTAATGATRQPKIEKYGAPSTGASSAYANYRDKAPVDPLYGNLRALGTMAGMDKDLFELGKAGG